MFPVANGYGVLDFAVDATVPDDYLRWASFVTTTQPAGNFFFWADMVWRRMWKVHAVGLGENGP